MAEQKLTVQFKVEEAGLLKGIRNAETMARAYDRINSTVASIGRSLAGLALGTGAFGLMARQIANVNAELQNATVSIAGLYSTLGNNSWTTSMDAARTAVKRLQKDAAAGVGELSDYLRVYQFVTARAGGHLGREKSYEFTRRALAAASVENPETGVRTIGIDINQALTSGLSAQDTPLINSILQKNGVGAKQFGAMTTSQRADAIYDALAKYEEAAKAVGKTWTAQVATFKDRLKDLVRAATGFSFETWTEGLQKVNAWLERVTPKVERVAYNLGGRTGGALLAAGVGLPLGVVGLKSAAGIGYTARALAEGGVGVYNRRAQAHNDSLLAEARAKQAADADADKAKTRADREATRASSMAAKAQGRDFAAQAALIAAANKAEAARRAGLDSPFDTAGARVAGPRNMGPRHRAYSAFGIQADLGSGVRYESDYRRRGMSAFPGSFQPRGARQLGAGSALGLITLGGAGARAAASASPLLTAGVATSSGGGLGGAAAGALGGAGVVGGGMAGLSAGTWALATVTAALALFTAAATAAGVAIYAVNTHLSMNKERWVEVQRTFDNVTAATIQTYDNITKALERFHQGASPILNMLGGKILDDVLWGLNRFADMIAVVGRTAMYYGSLAGAAAHTVANPTAENISRMTTLAMGGVLTNPHNPGASGQAFASDVARARGVGGGMEAAIVAAAAGLPGATKGWLEGETSEFGKFLNWENSPYAALSTQNAAAQALSAKYGLPGAGPLFSPTAAFTADELFRSRGLNEVPAFGSTEPNVKDAPTTNVYVGNVNVTVKGEVNEDPRRIAVAVGQVFEDIHRNSRRARARKGL